MTKISSGGGVFNSLATRRVVYSSTFLVLASALAITPSVFGAGSTNGQTRVEMEVSTSIAMKIASPNDVDPDCIAEVGKTYGVANRYASSTGEGGKVVDTFNGNEGQADELNTNTSCAKLSMEPNNFDSTYSDVTVFTNSPSGYALTVQSAENVSPNLVNVSDNTQYIPAGTLTENNGTVTGGQNKWAYKTNNGIITDWTAMTTSPAPIKAYDNYTEGGDTTRVTYGISTGNNPTGTYTTELTYTATMFDGINPYTNYMQDFSADDHISDPTNTEYTVFDSRDQKQYRAAKLADGNIWMTEDLKLGGDSAITLTPANSDVSSNYTLPAEDTGAWCNDQSAACYNQSSMLKTGAPNGYLYNWYAATAGTGTYSTDANQNASASICPKGWKLPTKDQYVALDQAYGGSGINRSDDAAQVNKFLAAPLNFNYTGYRESNVTIATTNNAHYWSRTAVNNDRTYHLYLNPNGNFSPQFWNDYRYYGFAIRCVAEKTTLADITNMQDMTPAVIANTAAGASKTLIDERDNKSYLVAKLADNNIWMAQDLKLGGDTDMALNDELSDAPATNFILKKENAGSWCYESSSSCQEQSLMTKTGVPNGYLYNWYAATAGTGTNEIYSTEASGSICPKGWRLPSTAQTQTLSATYGGSTGSASGQQEAIARLMTTPVPGFNWTGWKFIGGISGSTTDAAYWTRSSIENLAIYFDFSSDGAMNPWHFNGRYFGFAIRCVAAS